MGGIKMNPIIGIVLAILFIGMGNCADNLNASKVPTETGENLRNSAGAALFKPIKPKTPDCSTFFPGTPAWNECFRVFTAEMANFNTRMQEHMQKYKQEDGANGASSVTQFGPGYYSESHQNSHSMSTSNNFIGGYAISTENLPVSTSIVNGVLKVTLRTGPLDKFDSKIEGQEIKLNALSQGQPKTVKIIVPNGISINDVKIDRTPDAIYITAPVKNGNGGNSNFQWSSSSGNGASSTNSFHNTGGEFNTMGGMPPIPDYSNMFGNMFQNIFGLAFGGRNFGGRAIPMQPQMGGYNNPFPNYYTPQVWFY